LKYKVLKKQNEASEQEIPKGKNTDLEPISEPKNKIPIETITDLLENENEMNKSAMLNLNKFLYAYFTKKSTTNLRKKHIKQTNLKYLKEW